MTDFKARVLQQLDAGKEYESDGFGMPGLVADYCHLAHWEDEVRDEIDRVVAAIREDDWTFETEEEFFESMNDWELHAGRPNRPDWDVEIDVVHAGVADCFAYLADHDTEPVNDIQALYFAVYCDLQRALVKAFCEVVKTVEDNDTEF